MAGRLNVAEEFKLAYDIPYLTGKGETVDFTTVPIMERRQGVHISYCLTPGNGRNLDQVFPESGVDSLARLTVHVLSELGMQPRRTILQLEENSLASGVRSVEGRAPVNRDRDTVLIILTKSPFVYKYGYELVLWHQAMHAKDRWEYRFPSAHPLVDAGEWLDVLWHLSIDGRLDKLGKPHYSLAERVDEALRVLIPQSTQDAPAIRRLCEGLWGSEVSAEGLARLGREIGVAVDEAALLSGPA